MIRSFILITLIALCGVSCVPFGHWGRAGAGVGAADSTAPWLQMPPTDALHNPALLPFRQWRAVKRTEAGFVDTLSRREWRDMYRAESGLAKLALKARELEVKEATRAAKFNARAARRAAKAEGQGWLANLFTYGWPWLVMLALILAVIWFRKRT